MENDVITKTTPIIDCDIHQTYTSHHELLKYLDEPYKTRVKESGFGYPGGLYYSVAGGVRKDSFPTDTEKRVPGSSYDLIKKQLLDKYNIKYALLNGGGMLGISLMTEQAFPSRLAKAYNDWLIENWLPLDKRFLGSMMVAAQDPEEAAKEIRRLGDNDRIPQVLLSSITSMPIGQKFFHPIFEAAHECNKIIAFHPGGNQSSGTAPVPTPVGFPQYYLEWHTLLPNAYMSQLTSVVVEGVFEKFPGLKVLLIESGISWLVGYMWRFDKNYKSLRKQTPWLKKLPSDYIKENVFFTTQPFEEPFKQSDLTAVYEMLGIESNLLFSSDYPHWDFDDPYLTTKGFSKELQEKILFKNACGLYQKEIK